MAAARACEALARALSLSSAALFSVRTWALADEREEASLVLEAATWS